MRTKRVVSFLVLAVFLFGLGAYSKPAAKTFQYGQIIEDASAPADMAIANEERLIQMLIDSGRISKHASYEEAEKEVQKYLNEISENNKEQKIDKDDQELIGQIKENLNDKGLVRSKGKAATSTSLKPVKEEKWNGDMLEEKILVLLIDYPDYPHNSIQPEETDLYYDNYSVKHFNDMLFGENGYKGPNGENLISMKQYYEQQSGGSYTVSGSIAGWYTASHNAAYYGENSPSSHNIRAKNLVFEALLAAAEDPDINLDDFDIEDRYDLDEDGDFYEPDGIIDHLMVIHSGVGEEAGGGALGEDAVWSHRSKIANNPVAIPGTSTDVPYWKGQYVAWDYTMVPEDGAAGVFCHEYGHDLTLPDEYDTIYSGRGEAIEYWSLMASGNWTGKVPGTEPIGFSPYAKQWLQAYKGGNWLTGTTIDFEDITKKGTTLLLDQANTKGTNNDAVRINLPDRAHQVVKPYKGKYMYYGGKGNDGEEILTSMSTEIDLRNASSAELKFKTWYDIEEGWDFATIQVREVGEEEWDPELEGNITTDEHDPDASVIVANGITGSSNGKWVNAEFDLDDYAGEEIELKFQYETDKYSFGQGFYVDNITVEADNDVIFGDDAEKSPKFELDGFTKTNGLEYAKNYYLLEWRNHEGVDTGLKNIAVGDGYMSYDPGLVIWYVDEFYSDNWVGIHPSDGFLGVVDADQKVNYWKDYQAGTFSASTVYQIHDAAFGLKNSGKMYVDQTNNLGWKRTLLDRNISANNMFDDSKAYMNDEVPDGGRNIPHFGLKIRVTGESSDRSTAKILISK